MQAFQFQTVPQLISGIGSINHLHTVLEGKGHQKLLLVTDNGMLAHGLEQAVLHELTQLGLAYCVYSDIQADPTVAMVQHAADFARAEQVDVVLGFGGGSPMDVAKLIALLAHPEQTQRLEDMYGVNNAKGPRLPLILVPTTAGTGSEVTPVAIVTTGETTKMGVVAPVLLADVAILDAQFTVKLPAHITAATGIDAMVHAIEAYTSKHKKNPYSDLLAKQALTLLDDNLPKVLHDPINLLARQNMLMGAMFAGQAFANAPVAAVHALAYPLGGHFHLSHGHSNALVLLEVLKFNAPKATALYAELMQHLQPNSRGTDSHLCDLLIQHLQQHLLNSGLKLKLRDLGIQQHDLALLAQDAMLQTRLLQNNPRELTEADALGIYQATF